LSASEAKTKVSLPVSAGEYVCAGTADQAIVAPRRRSSCPCRHRPLNVLAAELPTRMLFQVVARPVDGVSAGQG
jgi:hypothetical protein